MNTLYDVIIGSLLTVIFTVIFISELIILFQP
jgi:hypothetical protein